MSKYIFGIFKNLQIAEQVVQELNTQDFEANTISILCKTPTGATSGMSQSTRGTTQSPYNPSPEEDFSVESTGPRNMRTERNPSGSRQTPSQTPSGSKPKLPQGLSRLPGITQIDLPGTGPFVAAGPIVQSLKNNQGKGNGQLLTNALTKLGVPEAQATKIAKKLTQNNNILLAVAVNAQENVESAKEIFENQDATDVIVSSETVGTGKKSQW